ncbi:melanocortin receptor 4-like [Orbicella faveolata]|uniref:melanocortin receptor 4-like n=1 Tax=Orbicella faveolata TaxID=48498 RepID=UPI0009E44449|nr:melanocortin receptor 4-like [Orbicella faveolata]
MEKRKYQTYLQLQCSAGWTSGIHKQWIYLSAVNIFLSITAVLGNTLILVALRKVSSLHPPSKLLFRCLATTDLCVGVITEPLSVVCWTSLVYEEWNLCRYVYISSVFASNTLCSVSLLTASAISVDRLLALFLGLRYRQVVTLGRTYLIVAIFWIMSVIAPVLFLLNPLITIGYVCIGTITCLATSVASYTKIFQRLRHHQIQVQGHVQQEQPGQINPLNIQRYRKTVYSALWVQCSLVACYLPNGILIALVSYNKTSPSSVLMLDVAATLMYLHSSLNPILYCWKISEVKQAVKETIREALCCFSS